MCHNSAGEPRIYSEMIERVGLQLRMKPLLSELHLLTDLSLQATLEHSESDLVGLDYSKALNQ